MIPNELHWDGRLVAGFLQTHRWTDPGVRQPHVSLLGPLTPPQSVAASLSKMLVPAFKLQPYLIPDQTVELRRPDFRLADSALPFDEAWRLVVADEVEGKVIGTRLKYLRLLPTDELALRRDLQKIARSRLIRSSSTVIAHTGMGAYLEPLREVSVGLDTFGDRYVTAEGDFCRKCWTHSGLNF